MDAVSSRVIRGDTGTPESDWLPWLALRRIRSLPLDALCPADARLVVVAPHPDDEVLACGGLLAMRAAQGMPSLVIAVTDGEASHGAGDANAKARLGARRAQESQAGLGMLGVPLASIVRCGLPDGGGARLVEAVLKELRLLLRPSDVVVTTWRMDGHPDHEAVGDAARQACAGFGCRLLQAPVWMWHWAEPGDARVPWKDLVALDLSRPALGAKQDALQRHGSQLEAREGGAGPVLVPTIMERAARAREYYFQ